MTISKATGPSITELDLCCLFPEFGCKRQFNKATILLGQEPGELCLEKEKQHLHKARALLQIPSLAHVCLEGPQSCVCERNHMEEAASCHVDDLQGEEVALSLSRQQKQQQRRPVLTRDSR